jgi:hypothetical protein
MLTPNLLAVLCGHYRCWQRLAYAGNASETTKMLVEYMTAVLAGGMFACMGSGVLSLKRSIGHR